MVGNGAEGVSVLDPKWGISQNSVGEFLANNPGASFLGSVPLYASGTDWHPGGQAWVGERGPELVNLPRGSSVTPNDRLGSGFDYERLAAAIAKQPISLAVSGRQIAVIIRRGTPELEA